MPTLPAALVEQSMKLHSAASWVELWMVAVDASRGYFLCCSQSSITFGGKTYSAFPMERDDEAEDSEGTIQELTIRVANIDRAIQAEIDAGNLRGKQARKLLVNTAATGSANNYAGPWRYTILSADCSDVAAIFRLGTMNPVTREFPGRRYNRNRCDTEFGGTLCGFDTTRSGALATCDLSLLGALGCKAHGDDEVAAGMPRQHPHNYQGEPGLLRGPYV